MAKRAAIYQRVSTEEQAKEGYSIGNQEDVCRAYADERGYSVVDVYSDEGASRDTLDRPHFSRMLRDIRDGMVDVIVTKHPDRLAAGPALGAARYHIEVENRCPIEYVEVRYEGEAKEIFLGLQGGIAQNELDTIRRRAHGGRVRKAREGKVSPMPTNLYGYQYNLTTKEYEHDRAEAPVVLRVCELYAKGVVPAAIARTLNEECVPTGLQSDGRRHTKGWTADRITRMVTMEQYYSGVRIANRFYGKKERERGGLARSAERPKAEWIAIPNAYPPIITEELWRRMSAQRQANRDSFTYSRIRKEWMLAGKLYCTVCGNRFASKWGSPYSRKKLANGESKRYPKKNGPDRYYKCYHTINYPHLPSCRNPKRLPAQELEDAVWKSMSTALQDPDLLFEMIDRECSSHEERMVALTSDIWRIRHTLYELELEQNRYIELYGKGKISEAKYDEFSGRIDEQIRCAKSERKLAEREIGRLIRMTEDGQELVQRVKEIVERFTHPESWPEEARRDAIARLVTKITIDGDNRTLVHLELLAIKIVDAPDSIGYELNENRAVGLQQPHATHSAAIPLAHDPRGGDEAALAASERWYSGRGHHPDTHRPRAVVHVQRRPLTPSDPSVDGYQTSLHPCADFTRRYCVRGKRCAHAQSHDI